MSSSKSSKSFSKQEALKVGFETVKKNFSFFFSVFVIVSVILIVSQALQGSDVDIRDLNHFLINVISWIVNVIIGMGLIKITLDFIDGKKPKIRDLFYTKNFVSYLIASIVRGIIVFAGILLLVIPGIIFSLRLQFATYLVIDKGMGPIDAIKESWNKTRGNTWNLFLFWLLILLVNLAGLALLLVGLLFTVPLSMVATAFVYRKLLGK